MNIKKQSGIGLTEIVILMLLWWCIAYIFFDWQLSLRVERTHPNADIFDAIKDSAVKSFTITDHGFIEKEDITNDTYN